MSKMWQRADFWPAEPKLQSPADDFARGVAEGRRTVEAEFASERDALLQLIESLETLQPPSPALLTEMLLSAVERLVADIVGAAPIDAALLNARAAALASTIATEAQAVLAVNPGDRAFVDDDRLPFPVISDPALLRGTVEARTSGHVIEDGVASAMGRLRAQIRGLGIPL